MSYFKYKKFGDDLQNMGGRPAMPLVFTNGCFDILHPGHFKLLSLAAMMGELHVGINSDASFTRLKGRRPTFTQAERKEMLYNVKGVDCVYIFDEDTPLKLIRRVKPNVLVKGEDSPAPLVGEAEVKEWGGKVIRVPTVLAPGGAEKWSSSNIRRHN